MQQSAYAALLELLPYLRDHRRELFQAILLVLALTAVTLAQPIILRFVIDHAVPHSDYRALISYSALYMGLLGLGVFLSYRQILLVSAMGLSIVNDLKRELFERILSLELTFFNKNRVGWILARIESDSEELKQFFSHVSVRLLSNLLTFVGIVCILLFSDFQIAMAMLVVCAIMLVCIIFFLARMKKIYNEVRESYARVSGFLAEYVQGVFLVRLFGRQAQVESELEKVGEARYQTELRASKFEYGFWSVFTFFSETQLIAAVLLFGIPQVQQGTMSLGKLIMFLEFARRMIWPLLHFSESFNTIQRSLVAARRILELKVQPGEICESDQVYPSGEQIEELRFENVNYHYEPENLVLNRIQLTVKQGERIALVGPSGGGKSTFASLLCRFFDPTEGRILVNGRDLAGIERTSWREKIGLVLQDSYFFPGTILENLRVQNQEITEERVREAARNLGTHEIIEKLGYSRVLEERGRNLSLGERQLLSFTRALVQDPEILVLDEATASMDPHTENLIQEALDKLMEGRTAVLIAHRLSTIRHVDRILFLENGKIQEQGTHDTLVGLRGRYYRMFSLQTRFLSRTA